MIARFLPLALVALLAVPAQAQKPAADNGAVPTGDVFRVVDNPPRLIGGLEGLTANIRYPEAAKATGAQGTVIVQFVVDEQGNVTDEKIVRGVVPELDAEALRVVREAQFEPGTDNGQPVKVRFSLPIVFKLDADR